MRLTFPHMFWISANAKAIRKRAAIPHSKSKQEISISHETVHPNSSRRTSQTCPISQEPEEKQGPASMTVTVLRIHTSLYHCGTKINIPFKRNFITCSYTESHAYFGVKTSSVSYKDQRKYAVPRVGFSLLVSVVLSNDDFKSVVILEVIFKCYNLRLILFMSDADFEDYIPGL